MKTFRRRWLPAGGTVFFFLVSAVSPVQSGEPVSAIQAEVEIPPESLLDVGIQVFDPGLADEEESELEEKGIFPEVRKSEARFIPLLLMNTLETTGHWGAVRVVPVGTEGLDVVVSGVILQSTGHDMKLYIRVVDSAGRVWRNKVYREPADSLAYHAERIESAEPYQSLYNRIANDMLAARRKLRDEEVIRIREISGLRFGAHIAPEIYGDYLSVNHRGRYSIERLPSIRDPMWERISRLRDRDYLFVDTLNEYYADFFVKMYQVYFDWRVSSFEERQAFLEMRAKARKRKWLGGLLIFAGILSDDSGLQDAAILGGVAVIDSGVQKGKEAKIHLEALRELGASFDSEIAPLRVEVEGHTLRLEGSAENQFSEWRRLLREIFTAESGLPLDPNQQPEAPGPAAES